MAAASWFGGIQVGPQGKSSDDCTCSAEFSQLPHLLLAPHAPSLCFLCLVLIRVLALGVRMVGVVLGVGQGTSTNRHKRKKKI